MVSLIARVLLVGAAVVTEWFVAVDAPNFGVVQAMVAIVLLAFVVGVVAFWPKRWR